MDERFTIDYVMLPSGRIPARDFIDSLDDEATAQIDAFIQRLAVHGTRMHGKFVHKLTGSLLELRVKHFDRIFRVLFFYQPGALVVVTSAFQKKSERTPWAEIERAERLRKLWLKYSNDYPESPVERNRIPREHGL